jgi:hypothetical protein
LVCIDQYLRESNPIVEEIVEGVSSQVTSRRTVLRGLVTVPIVPACLFGAGCRKPTPEDLSPPVLYADGIHDDAPALSKMFGGKEVLFRGNVKRFYTGPPKGWYFLSKSVRVPRGAKLAGCVFYAWARPALILEPGATADGCWTCLSPDPFASGHFDMTPGILRL